MNPLISICIPTYKRQRLLVETLKSVLNQTYSKIEIIVSDNDPKKSSEKVVLNFHSKKNKIHSSEKECRNDEKFRKSI